MNFFGYAGSWPASPARPPDAPAGAGAAAPAHGGCSAPYLHTDGGITVALRGTPLWYAGAELKDPARELFDAYRARGKAFLGQLTGRFAVAVVDRPNGRTLLALDPVGIERLVYRTAGDAIAFGTSAEAVANFGGSSARLRHQALFDYLLLHMVPAPDTVFEGVAKLRPGTCAILERGRLTIERFWTPQFVEDGHPSFEALRDELHASLQSAVRDARPDDHTGAFLSGGLDSSSVAGMLGRVTGKSPRTFSIGFGVDSYNELEYAHIANRRFGATAREYNVTAEDIVDSFRKVATAYDEPFGNSSAVPTYFCARFAAANGIDHLLAGDGGDEIFGGNERYARQRIFEAYRVLPAGLRARFVEPLIGHIAAESRIMPLRKLRSYVDQARIPLPERLESWNFMYRTDLAAMLEPEFQASIDPKSPLRVMAELYASASSPTLLHRMLYYDWHYTLSDNDLRKVGTMCELGGVRVSYPLLDPRVLDVSVRVPPRMKMKGLELRSFYKQAMRDFLPAEILAKTKHGFGLPFGVWLKTHPALGELIYGLLSDLKARRIVRAAFLDELIEQHRGGHASYFGYAIWDLAMLEAWLQAHGARPGPVALAAA